MRFHQTILLLSTGTTPLRPASGANSTPHDGLEDREITKRRLQRSSAGAWRCVFGFPFGTWDGRRLLTRGTGQSHTSIYVLPDGASVLLDIYLTFVDRSTLVAFSANTSTWPGSLCASAGDGNISYCITIPPQSRASPYTERPSGRALIAGQPFLSSSNTIRPHKKIKIISLQLSDLEHPVYAVSPFPMDLKEVPICR
ncbi:hypothetical protein EDB85DRAFT_149821 [Lactarius pseudohatsudake]|nr:hypothetical protein EDB85DRAFT_149821 [Lactarius pseudohatsudake]